MSTEMSKNVRFLDMVVDANTGVEEAIAGAYRTDPGEMTEGSDLREKCKKYI